MLRMPDVSLAGILDTHLLFSPPFCFVYTVAAIRSWSPGAEDPRCLLRRGDSRRPGVDRRFPGRRPRLFDLCCVCASLLKANLYLVSVLRYYCFRWLVFSSWCIRALVALACNNKAWIVFIYSVVLWYFHRGTLISFMYSVCMNSTWS